MKKCDYMIVGSGLFGATFAHLATKQGKKCLVIDKQHGPRALSRLTGVPYSIAPKG